MSSKCCSFKLSIYQKTLKRVSTINYILKYVKIKKTDSYNISQYYCFYCSFDQINAVCQQKRLNKSDFKLEKLFNRTEIT